MVFLFTLCNIFAEIFLMKKILFILSLLPLIANGQIIATFAGNGTPGGAGDGGPSTTAQLNAPGGLAFDGGR